MFLNFSQLRALLLKLKTKIELGFLLLRINPLSKIRRQFKWTGLSCLPKLVPAILITAIFTWFFIEPTLAADPGLEKYASLGGLFVLFSTIIIVIIVFISLLLGIWAGELIGSTYVFQTGMGDTLHLIWTVVRNFVNTGFIILLLILAIMVIFGIGQDGGTGLLKKVLPKFILALVVVNLTFFGARFILSVNDVFATTIFTLPKTIIGDIKIRAPCKEPGKPSDPNLTTEKCLQQLKKKLGENQVLTSPSKMQGILTDTFGEDSWVDLKVKNFINGQSLPLALMTSMLDIKNLTSAKTNLDDSADAIISALGSLLIAAAVGFVFLMLFFAFLIRLVVLWVMIAFSPVIALGLVFKEMFNFDLKGGGDFDILDTFIKHAFMPTLVAIPLSVGMIMLAANNAIIYDVNLDFLSLSSSDIANNLHAILWWVASLVVIWFGTNQVLQTLSPKFAHAITQKIHQGVGKFAGEAASVLQYAPIMPGWAGGSLHGIHGVPTAAMERVKQASRERERQAGTKLSQEVFGDWVSIKMTPQSMQDSIESTVLSQPVEQLGQALSKFTDDILDKESTNEAKTFVLPDDVLMQLNQKFSPTDLLKEDDTYYTALRKIAETAQTNLNDPLEREALKQKLDLIESAKSPDNQAAPAANTQKFAQEDVKEIKTISADTLIVQQGDEHYLVKKEGDQYETVVHISQEQAAKDLDLAISNLNPGEATETEQATVLTALQQYLKFSPAQDWAAKYQAKITALQPELRQNIATYLRAKTETEFQQKIGLTK